MKSHEFKRFYHPRLGRFVFQHKGSGIIVANICKPMKSIASALFKKIAKPMGKKALESGVQCRSEISEQRRRKIKARNTRIRVFFDASKIAYRIHVCAFVIHNRNFAFPVIVYEDKRINCVTADKSKIYICMYVALITNQFRSANAADENIHRALFPSLIPFKCNKGLERRAKLKQQIMPQKTEAMIFVSLPSSTPPSFYLTS